MSKRFIALIQIMTADQDKAFVDYLGAKGLGYWHWIDGGWLIDSDDDEITAEAIRDKVMEIAPGKYTVVLPVEARHGWAGFGPNADDRNMFTWIKQSWSTDQT